MERIKFEKTKEENSVEVFFAEKFEKLKRHQMDDDTSKIMISLIFSKIPEDDEEANSQFLVRLIDNRAKTLGYTFDLKTKLFLAVFTKTPGFAVSYCHYLAFFCKKNSLTHLSFNDFCSKAFPWGFPSEKELAVLWDSQKVEPGSNGSDNLLDYFEASKSITNIDIYKENRFDNGQEYKRF